MQIKEGERTHSVSEGSEVQEKNMERERGGGEGSYEPNPRREGSGAETRNDRRTGNSTDTSKGDKTKE